MDEQLIKEYCETMNKRFIKRQQLINHFSNMPDVCGEEMEDLINSDSDYILINNKSEELENKIFASLGMENLRAIFG